MKLKLETKNKQQELVKEYLESNASDSLVEKINNGVRVTKDNVELVNKKDLDGFFKYATNEARKLVEKGSSSACVEDNVVLGWAIHYFEEDSIEGTLLNLDGTPYKKPMPKSTYKPPVKVEPPKPTSSQLSMFDALITENKKEESIEDADEDEDDIEELSEEEMREFDGDIGEVDMDEQDELLSKLCELFDNNIVYVGG